MNIKIQHLLVSFEKLNLIINDYDDKFFILYESLRDHLIKIFNEIVEHYVYKGAEDNTIEKEKNLLILQRKYEEAVEVLNEIRDDNKFLKDENNDLKEQVEFLKDQIDANLVNPSHKPKTLQIARFSYQPFGNYKPVLSLE